MKHNFHEIFPITSILRLSRRLIICIEQTSIYKNTKTHEIAGMCFSTNAIGSFVSRTAITQNGAVSKRRTLLSCKIVKIINLPPYMPDEDKTFGGSRSIRGKSFCAKTNEPRVGEVK